MLNRGVLVIAAASAIAGCLRQTPLTEETEAAQNEVTALRSEISSLALSVAETQMLQREIQELRDAVQRLEFQAMNELMVTLRPNSEGYSVIRTTLGHITVDIASISAHANGTSVVLSFGNPLACDLRNVEFWLRYGETDSVGSPIEGGGKGKHVTVGKVLRGGRFTTVRIGLDDIKPHELGYVSIGNLQHGGIALTQ